MEDKIFENQYIKVFLDDVGYLRLTQKTGGVVVAPVYNDTYALIKHTRGNEVLLEFPRGFLEIGESHLNGAEREIKEELNFIAQDMEILGDLHTDSGLINDNVKAIRCKIKDLESLKVQTEEGILSCELYTRGEIMNAVRDNKIKDNFTLSVLMILVAKDYF